MARNRMIKPEFWEDDKIAECSPIARLLFVALWNFSDDAGYLENRTKWLKAKCLPYDEANIDDLLGELLSVGRVQIQNDIIFIPKFLKHQKIDKPRASDLKEKFELSTNGSRTLSEPSATKREEEIENEYEIETPPTVPAEGEKLEKGFDENSKPFLLAKLLFDLIRKNNEKAKFPNFQSWAADIDKMQRIDGNTFDEIELIIRWSQQDCFWLQNILSASKLREKFPELWIKAKSKITGAIKKQQEIESKTAFIS